MSGTSPVPPRFDALTVPLDPGVTLVEASAGTGKTFAITRLVLRLLLERKVEQLSQILVVTFTVKATQELVTRIRATLRAAERVWSDAPPSRDAANDDLFVLRERYGDAGRDIVQRALASLDDLAVSTIHGFCQRMLAESALESRIPFRTTFIQDEAEPFGRAAKDWARRRLMPEVVEAERVVGAGQCVEQWIRPFVMPFRRQPGTRVDIDPGAGEQVLLADFITSVSTSFDDEKKRRHLFGFDDLLQRLSTVLEEEGADGPLARRIRSRFGAALIDEFQDTDRTQFPIFSQAFAGCPLFLIGDPKQSIFRFRGADIQAYLRAAASAERRYTLLENYRSTEAYVTAVETLFTRAPDPFRVSASEIDFPHVKAATAPTPPGGLARDGRPAMEWWWMPGTLGKDGKTLSREDAYRLLTREIAHEIVRLHGDGLPFGSVAVLVRSNEEGRELKRVLDTARVPAVIGGDADVLASEEADELLRLAAAIAQPHDARAVRAAMTTRLWGSDAAAVAATLEAEGEAAWQGIVESFLRTREIWRTRGVAAAFGVLLADRTTETRLLALPDGERRLTNVRHITELAHDVWTTDGMAPAGFAAWVARERTVPNTPDRRELRIETDSAAVQILTIHKAKGLQFDVVFCPTLWSVYEGQKGPFGLTAALAMDGEAPVLDLGSAANAARLALAREEDAAEHLRLTYVALTRAVHRCYVAWGQIGRGNSAARSALGHLLRPLHGEDAEDVLRALVASSQGTMGWRAVMARDDKPAAREPAPADIEPRAMPLRLAAGQLETWRVSSYTRLIGEGQADGAMAGEEGRDVADPLLIPPAPSRSVVATGFRAFPAGARAGIALHEVFEHLDFARVAEPGTTHLVRRVLRAHGFADEQVPAERQLVEPMPAELSLVQPTLAEQRVHDVTAMLHAVSRTPLPPTGFTLADVPRAAMLREWRFDLSLATLSVRRIADVLDAHGSPHARAYAPILRTLRDVAASGYLNGVVDLAFEHDGRWWLADWKSNRLGDEDRDYDTDRLSAAMMNGHYTLQYHLYLVALHRHLRLRQPGYDPARHWGGVAYVFLRGVTDSPSSTAGWFFDTPTPALLDALDVALGRRA